MRFQPHLFKRAALLVGIAFATSVAPAFAAGACATCTPVSISSASVPASLTANSSAEQTPASSGLGAFNVTVFPRTGAVVTNLPAGLPAGTYQGWCATTQGDPVPPPTTFVATTVPPGAVTPVGWQNATVWKQVTYLLNHKQGASGTLGSSVQDVQFALWRIVGAYTGTLTPTAQILYDDATNILNYNTYVMGATDRTIVLLQNPTYSGPGGNQHIVIEVPYCASIGDRIWYDANEDGVQGVSPVTLGSGAPGGNALTVFGMFRNFVTTSSSTYQGYRFDTAEPGINGVTVQLLDASDAVLATTVTAASPRTYPYLPEGTNGWYYFPGLCPGTTYKVKIDNSQAALGSYQPTTVNAPAGVPTLDSNPNPATVIAPTGTDSTNDFGYKGTSPLTFTSCALTPAPLNVYYNSSVQVTGGRPPYKYFLDSGSLPLGLGINQDTGAITGIPTSMGTFSFGIRVVDSSVPAQTITSSSCSIQITGQPLGLSCAATSATAGAPYSSSLVASGGVAPYTYSIIGSLPANLTLGSSTGAITGVPSTAGTYSFQARVTDSNGGTANVTTVSCGLNVAPSGLTLRCASGSAVQGTPYSSSLVASGGTAPYAFSITAGALPPGLSLHPTTGAITGTPSASGTYSFTASVTDSTGGNAQTTTIQCQIVVSPPIVVTCPSGIAFRGVHYTSTFAVANGSGNYTYAITAGALPLDLTTSGATVRGIPASVGQYPFTVTVTDTQTNNTGTQACTIQVYEPPTLACNAGTGVIGAPYNATLVASGGYGRYSYSLGASPAPPSWISVNSTTGALTGTPTATGAFTFTGQVTDGLGTTVTVTASCGGSVQPRPTANCAVIDAVAGVAITPVALAPTGGAGAPYKFSAAGLPAGLSISEDGTISGTPAAAGTTSYTVTITDKDGNTGTINCSVTVIPPVTVTCATITASEGIAITPTQLSASGGVGSNYTFSATGLPAGVTLSSTGLLSGTPTVSGNFSYTVTVSDNNGHTGSSTCALNVTPAPPVTVTCATITANAGIAITPTQLSASGGIGTNYTFSATGLPTGVTLSSTGLLSGTPTVSGNFSYTVTVSDNNGHTGSSTCALNVTPAPPVTVTCATITANEGIAITSTQLSASGGVGSNYTFSATGLPAGITLSATGLLSGTPTVSGNFSYTVTVSDNNGHTGSSTCAINVTPMPPVTVTCATITANEGIAITPTQLSVSGGIGSNYTFSATGLPAGITLSSTGLLSGTPTVGGNFSYTVTVSDNNGHTGGSTCAINVTPMPPVSVTCATITANEGIAITPTQLSASGGIGNNYAFSATGLPAGITLSSTGLLSGTPTVGGNFSYTVTVSDNNGHTGSSTCAINVTPMPPVAVTCATITANEGIAITPTQLSASGGIGNNYAFSATGLPAGITLSSTGLLSGTPTVSGNFSYTVTVSDNNGHTGSSTCAINVAPIPPVSVTCATITANQGVAITPTQLSASGGIGNNYAFSATGLPAGITLSSTGLLNGTPTVSGNFSYTVTVSDNNGHTGSSTCSVAVTQAPPISATCATVTAVQGIAITSVQLSATGGYPGATYAFSATGLPSGLSLSSTGVLSGTPTASGNFNYSVTITDGKGRTTTLNCSVTVAPPPVQLTCAGGTAMVGSPYTSALSASLGVTPYSFSIVGGSLPGGLSLNGQTGAITGTPTAAGTFTFTGKVTDASGNAATNSASRSCSIVVSPLPAVTANCVAIVAMQGSPITPVTLSGSGGTGGTYTFTATGLPAGLTISSSGTISGTPTVSGTFNYTVTIKDKNNNIGTIGCSVTVTPVVVCAPTTFTMTGGSSSTNGTDGNIRTYTAANGVQVKVSAWSRTKSGGTWNQAWLGSYSAGLGVTDVGEDGSDPGHRVDNVGTRVNYVMYEFSSPVTVNKVYLDAVGGDSDISVWIGTANNPFANHITLSDSVLAGFGTPETNTASHGDARWADINGSNETGNVLVIAALTTETSTFDEFKIAKIETSCNSTTVPTPTAACVTVNAVQGVAITPVTMAGTGGAGGPYTFSATGLPAGLTMSSTGVISGTPTVTGTFSYTVTVKDKKNTAGTVTCSITVTPAPVCAPTTFTTTGGTASTGTAGNIRTFTAANGVQVKASAWARNKSTGAWSPAFLAVYSGGLGVTDPNEDGSDPSHRIDNNGMVNYVLFEFSAPVKVNKLYLDWADGDSDLRAWIGSKTNPFTNHNTLSDSWLAGLSSEDNDTTSTSQQRWADINAANLEGNILVVAADPDGSNDVFKIQKIETSCTSAPVTAACVSINATKGAAITSATMTGTGGAGGPYTFSATGLPTGLTMSSSGTISGTPSVTGTFSYTVTVKDKNNTSGTVTCSVTVNAPPISAGDFTTYTQGGWGASPSGNNPGMLLKSKFSTVYSSGSVSIGGTYKLTFTSSDDIKNFLPNGGTAAKLTRSKTNPTSGEGGVLAGQLLAATLSVDFSDKGILARGLGDLIVASGPMAGKTVDQVLAIANSVLGGGSTPSGLDLSDLVETLDGINRNFDNGTSNNGYLKR